MKYKLPFLTNVFVMFIVIYLDPKVTHLISQCQSKLATQHSKEKTLYTNMLGLK